MNPEEQAARDEGGPGPKLRPVNVEMQHSEIGFQAWSDVTGSKNSYVAINYYPNGSTSQTQYEVVSHLFKALWEKGYIILTTDYTNIYSDSLCSTLCRKDVQRWRLFSTSCTLWIQFASSNANGQIEIILSIEGFWMGCVMGFAWFRSTVHIYQSHNRQFYHHARITKLPSSMERM